MSSEAKVFIIIAAIGMGCMTVVEVVKAVFGGG
jgi:hypothetical protein